MKTERAEELYSDYAEGTLTPALRQALEQHFEADPSARADYARFAQIYSFLEQPLEEEVEVPLGFRAKILERAAAQQTQRETTWNSRLGDLFAGWFSATPQRRLAGGAAAGLAAVILAGMLMIHPKSGKTIDSGFGGSELPVAAVSSAVIQNVDVQPGPDSNPYHLFHLHLPTDVSSATVNAYVVTSPDQVTDPNQLSAATPALQNQHLTNHQAVAIPIAPLQVPPAGATIGLLVKWTPDDAANAPSSEVVYTPFGDADPTTAAPANTSFLEALKATAAHYGVTVVADADAVPTQAVTTDFSASDAATPLAAIAKSAGYSVPIQSGKTFYLAAPKP